MKVRTVRLLSLMACLVVLGCQNGSSSPPASKEKPAPAVANKGAHAGWWCREHGIPEEECLVCLHSEEELKKMNDWCDKHEFAKSQCFACDATLKEKFAAKYRAKFGKEPPAIPER